DRCVLFPALRGLIGMGLLPRLMELSPQSRFRCLVQARFLEAAREGLARIDAANPHAAGRAGGGGGGGAAPGARAPRRERLTAAHHLAAVYDLAVSRELGLRVNLHGTRNVVRFLAECPRLERLHYVSTCYVSGSTTRACHS